MNAETQEKHDKAQVAHLQARTNTEIAKAAMFVAIGIGSVLFGLAVML